MLLGQFLVLVATTGACILDLNANLQHVDKLVFQYRGQLLLDGLLEDEEPLRGIMLFIHLQELLALCHQTGHTHPQISETGDLARLVAGQSPDNPKQSWPGWHLSQEMAELRARHQEIGATVGVADCPATVLQLEERLLPWQPIQVPFPLQLFKAPLLADARIHSR